MGQRHSVEQLVQVVALARRECPCQQTVKHFLNLHCLAIQASWVLESDGKDHLYLRQFLAAPGAGALLVIVDHFPPQHVADLGRMSIPPPERLVLLGSDALRLAAQAPLARWVRGSIVGLPTLDGPELLKTLLI